MMAKPSEAAAAAPIVYVIDDDDGMRRALSLLLSTVGYKALVSPAPAIFSRTSIRTPTGAWCSIFECPA
jgi:FixJ family two-component response regulator